MKKTLLAGLVLALGVANVSFAAQAGTSDQQAERLMQAMKSTEQQNQDDSEIKAAELNLKFNKRVLAISKDQGPRSKAAFKKAVRAWMAYQKAMSDAVETSYTEAGGHGGASAATDCNLMTAEDFMKVLDQFYGR